MGSIKRRDFWRRKYLPQNICLPKTNDLATDFRKNQNLLLPRSRDQKTSHNTLQCEFQLSREAYQAAIGDGLTSKPIDVITRPGDVSCDDPEAVTLDINQVVYQLSLGDMSAPAHPDFIRRAKVEPLNVDNEVVINYSLYDPSNRAPYTPKKGPFIDQLTRLNSKLRFFMNSSEHVIVKLETTVTSPFRFGTSSTAQFLKDAYGSSIGDSFAALTGQENNIEGIQINYAFEFCTHKSMVKQPLNHCTGQTSP